MEPQSGSESSMQRLVSSLFREATQLASSRGLKATPNSKLQSRSERICRLIVDHAAERQAGSSIDLTEIAEDAMSEALVDQDDVTGFAVGSLVVDTFLASAKAPSARDNRGHYIPALLLARYVHDFIHTDEDVQDEEEEAEFRRETIEVFGERMFGDVPSAADEEVFLAIPLVSDLTRDEFESHVVPPLKYKLNSDPTATLDTLTSFVDVLTASGSGHYVDSHLTSGANVIGAALKAVGNRRDKSISSKGSAVLVSLVNASPSKAGTAVTDALMEAVEETADDRGVPDGLDACLVNVAKAMLTLRSAGKEKSTVGTGWRSLANDVVVPTLEVVGGSGRALSSWKEVAGPLGADAGASRSAPAAAPAPFAPSAVSSSQPGSFSLSSADSDKMMSSKEGDFSSSQPGSFSVSSADDEAASKKSAAASLTAGAAAFTSQSPEKMDVVDEAVPTSSFTKNEPELLSDTEEESSNEDGIEIEQGGDVIVNQGRASEPGVDYGEVNEEGLAVAQAVDLEGEDEFVSAALEYDPDSKPAIYRNRRVQVYSAVTLLIIVAAAVGIAVGITMTAKKGDEDTKYVDVDATPEPSPEPTAQPTTFREQSGIVPQLENISGDAVNDPETPQGRAKDWILHDDPMQLASDDPSLLQRYILATFAYATQIEEWKFCGGAGNATAGTECEYLTYNPMTGQDDKKYAMSWLSGASECEWMGITCSSDGIVRGVDLPDNGLEGRIPTEITRLDFLIFFYAQANSLYGFIPSEFGEMQHLQALELHYNFLGGTVPEELYDASKLQSLNLAGQGYYRWLGFPSFVGLQGTLSSKVGQLQGLKGYHMNHNSIRGPIPKELGDLEFLTYVRIYQNDLTGKIPTELTKLEKLRELYVFTNDLHSTIPENIGNMKDLRDLRWYDNHISGPIPESFYDLENLRVFRSQDTHDITGTISTSIGKLTKLNTFMVQNNKMHGPIPEEMGNCRDLTTLWLHKNDFTGTIPEWHCELRDLLLTSSYADCAKDNLYGPEFITCSCCTDCCDHTTDICLQDD